LKARAEVIHFCSFQAVDQRCDLCKAKLIQVLLPTKDN
jgi:hypothetical protein